MNFFSISNWFRLKNDENPVIEVSSSNISLDKKIHAIVNQWLDATQNNKTDSKKLNKNKKNN